MIKEETLNTTFKLFAFGSYPQSEVRDESLIGELNRIAGELPFEKDAQGWTSYKFYKNKVKKDFMWYMDVDLNGEKYRGVYFDSYRPFLTDTDGDFDETCQDANGYLCLKTYWFKFESIKWQMLRVVNGALLLLSEKILDCREFYSVYTEKAFKHNGGIGFGNNYTLSEMRRWLNDDFYNTAFSEFQKKFIEPTLVDNSYVTLITGSEEDPNIEPCKYLCENTTDNVFLLSMREASDFESGFNAFCYDADVARKKVGTDYAKCLGLAVSNYQDEDGFSWWWLRSPHFTVPLLTAGVQSDGACDMCIDVASTDNGVAPAIRIKSWRLIR